MRFSSALLTAVLFCAGAQVHTTSAVAAAKTTETFKKMNAEELDKAMKAEKVFVFDSNSETIYKDGHVPGAKHMPFDAVSADKMPAAKDAKVVFYCMNERCTASHDAAKKAMEIGYKNVWVMTGGIAGWKSAGKPVEK